MGRYEVDNYVADVVDDVLSRAEDYGFNPVENALNLVRASAEMLGIRLLDEEAEDAARQVAERWEETETENPNCF